MGMSKRITIGYQYYMDIHAGIGRGPMDELVEIKVGGKRAWRGSITGNSSIRINQPNLFGGKKKEGGIDGTLTVLMGGPTQTAPASLAAMLGGDVPGFRGVVTTFFSGLVAAMNPYLKPWEYRWRRVLAGWDGPVWYPERARIELAGGAIHAMNPAHIIYECLTNRDWGAGNDRSRLNDASFRAAADRLYSEGFGLCLRWARQDNIDAFIQTVLDHIGGNFYLSRFDGTFHLTLNRDDYDADTLPLFDEDSGLLGIDEDDNAAAAGAANEIIVEWHDPIKDQVRRWRERGLASIHSIGRIFSETLEFPGLPTAELAGRVAVRELRQRVIPLKRFKVRLDRRGYRLEPGQPFRIRSLRRGIETLVVRAGRFEDGTLADSTITITAVQDIFGLPASSMSAVQPPGWEPPNYTPAAITQRRLIEQTWRDLARTTDPANLELIDSSACYLSALAVKPTSLSLGYVLETRVGTAEWAEQNDDGVFCPSGLLSVELAPGDTSIHLTSGVDLDFVEVGTAALIGDEFVRIDSWDPASHTGTIARGCVDTVPARWPAGTRVWFLADNGATDPTEYAPGVTVQARLLTETSQGRLDPALATIDSLQLQGRQARPYPPARVRINGAAWPTEVEGEIVLSWAHRDRLLQADQLIDNNQGSIGPEPGTTYNARLLRADTGEELARAADVAGTSVTFALVYSGDVIAELWSVRDGLDSWQRQRLAFQYLAGGPRVVAYTDAQFSTGTNQAHTVPAATQAGDYLVACLMHRSALTPPAGWTLLEAVGPFVNDSGTQQWTAVYGKPAEAADVGSQAVFEQAESGRMASHLLVVRGEHPITVAATAKTAVSEVVLYTIPIAEVTGTGGAQLAITAVSTIYASSGVTNEMVVSAGWTQTTPAASTDSANQLRLGAAHRTVVTGELASGEFSMNYSASRPNGYGSVTILLAADEPTV